MRGEIIATLAKPATSKIIFLVMDGLGGLPNLEGKTELEAAHTPNLDALAAAGICGLLDPIDSGITPGSGPAHFALFGYDPWENNIGRGLLEAAGIDFPMREGDLLIRVNFASLTEEGTISDRRAGRIKTEENARICRKLQGGIRSMSDDVRFFCEPVKDHRALLVLRGGEMSEKISESDPQQTGVKPLAPLALAPEAERTALLLQDFLEQAQRLLKDEERVHIPLLRGYARHRRYPSMQERYQMRSLAIASYPMYRGIARLLGMSLASATVTIEEEFAALIAAYEDYDFFFLHIKGTDSKGEDGDFAGKVAVIEQVDSLLPQLTALAPTVLVVTGDHSTPAEWRAHSWHPVPVLLYAKHCRPDLVREFGERACLQGAVGIMPMQKLMALALANAGRLAKFGA